jgi:hypothetical protein
MSRRRMQRSFHNRFALADDARAFVRGLGARVRLGLVVMLALVVCAGTSLGEPLNAVRGLANHVDVAYGARLRSRADQSPTSPVLVRVSPVDGRAGVQRIEFIGTVAGSYDLREYIEREDGRAITELAAIPVIIGSHLPPDAGTDLYSSESSWFGWAAHYRALLWGAIVMWAGVPVAYLVVRAMRKPAQAAPVAPAPPPPTIEEQLVAAIQVAGSGPLSVDDRGRLELLVFRYFGGRAGAAEASDQEIAEVFRRVRADPETRGVITAIERWLHAREGEGSRGDAAAALEELRRSRLSMPTRATPNAAATVEATA